MTKFHMKDMTPAEAGKFLRDCAEGTNRMSKNWDNFQDIATQIVTDAFNHNKARAEAAESRVTALEAALLEAFKFLDDIGEHEAADKLRAALTNTADKGGEK